MLIWSALGTGGLKKSPAPTRPHLRLFSGVEKGRKKWEEGVEVVAKREEGENKEEK